MSVVLNWNGKGIPDELRALPPGRYVIEVVDEAPELTDDEQEELETALASVRQGRECRSYREATSRHPLGPFEHDPSARPSASSSARMSLSIEEPNS
jgi:hypothetical protein